MRSVPAEHLGHPPVRTGGVRLFGQFVQDLGDPVVDRVAWWCGKVDPERLGYLLTRALPQAWPDSAARSCIFVLWI
jgi:hypothetical protein